MSGLSLSETTQLAQFALALDSNPVRLAGRLVGIDPETRELVPKWGWYVAGGGALVAVGLSVRHYFLHRPPKDE